MFIQGTPWHVTTGDLLKNEERRHKLNCAHYDKYNSECLLKGFRCDGSAHCDKFIFERDCYFVLKAKEVFSNYDGVYKSQKKIVINGEFLNDQDFYNAIIYCIDKLIDNDVDTSIACRYLEYYFRRIKKINTQKFSKELIERYLFFCDDVVQFNLNGFIRELKSNDQEKCINKNSYENSYKITIINQTKNVRLELYREILNKVNYNKALKNKIFISNYDIERIRQDLINANLINRIKDLLTVFQIRKAFTESIIINKRNKEVILNFYTFRGKITKEKGLLQKVNYRNKKNTVGR